MDYTFSEKQAQVLKTPGAFIDILEGSIRSGKTWVSTLKWLHYVLTSPHKEFLMSGQSGDSLYRNIVVPLRTMLGDAATYKKSERGGPQLVVRAPGVRKVCYCRGAGNAASYEAIQGITVGGWYADEITVHHESFVNMALGRLSLPGAKAIWTTNPNSPFHFIKTQFIDKADYAGYNVWSFRLDDNPALPESYKQQLRKSYAGLWYRRYILGEWVQAEGAIYDMWEQATHVVPAVSATDSTEVIIACDYGTSNPTVFLAMGYVGNIIHVLGEYHYDGRAKGRQKTDAEYVQDLVQFMSRWPMAQQVIIDTSAASFIAACRAQGLAAMPANNAVLEGIRTVATLLTQGLLVVCEECQETIREFSAYVWDSNAQLRGEDRPLKQNDHCMDSLRYGVMALHTMGVQPTEPAPERYTDIPSF